MPDSELNYGGNLSRDNFGNNEVNDQNLPVLYIARNEVNPIDFGEIIYQPLWVNVQVLNSNRNGFDLISQRGQRGFISQLAISQPGC